MSLLPRFLQEFRQDPLAFQSRLEKEGKNVFQTSLLWQKFVFLSDPAAIQHVIQSNGKNYKKDRIGLRISLLLGRGLLTSDGEHWKKQRKLMSPAFHAEHLDSYSEAVMNQVEVMERDWKSRIESGADEIDIHREMMKLTLQITGQAFFGSDLTKYLDQLWKPMEWVIEEFTRRMNHQLVNIPIWIPTPSNRKLKSEIAKLDHVIEEVIAGARADKSGEKKNLLAVLVASAEEDRMTTKELRDEILTLFLAGHETTASVIAWSIYQLARNPEIAEKVRGEVLGFAPYRALQYGDLFELEETRKVLMETMRLYPPGWMLSREAIADDEVGGVKITKGTIVISSAYAVQRSARLWKSPEKFDPSRFAPENTAGRHKFAYFPFGGGSRVCIGSSFAMMESALVLATLASRFDFVSLTEDEVRPITRVTLRPERGIPLRISSSSGAASKSVGNGLNISEEDSGRSR